MAADAKEVQSVLVRMPREEHEALKSYARITGASVNGTIVRAIREFLEGKGRLEEVDALLARARSDYAGALDKLKDL